MKKILSFTLVLLMLIGALTSCRLFKGKGNDTDSGNGKESESQSQTQTDDVEETESETTRKELVNEDFSQGGVPRDYTIYARKGRTHYLYAERDSTDKVVSGTYRRNIKVQNDFGVKIKLVEDDGDQYTDEWVIALASSGVGYDLAVPDYWWLLEQQGYFLNIYDREELEFDQDYWFSQWNDNMTINDKLYTVVGDASLEVLENIEVVFFNKKLTDSLALDMYKLVDDKQWTIDKMLDIGKEVSGGLDTANTTDDVYGSIYDAHSLCSQLFSAGLRLTEIKDNGTIELIAESRTVNIDIQEKVKSLIHDSTTYYHVSTMRSYIEDKAGMLGSDKAVFFATALYAGSYIKATGVDYGVIPMPMFEENGEYVSTSYGVSVFAIPKTAADYHFSAVILDALNYHSRDTIVTNFYDMSMKLQIADNPNDARMMDIARDALYYDLAWVLDMGQKVTVFSAYTRATSEKTVGLSSELSKAMTSSYTGLSSIIAFYNEE